jgi:hypothetical protein
MLWVWKHKRKYSGYVTITWSEQIYSVGLVGCMTLYSLGKLNFHRRRNWTWDTANNVTWVLKAGTCFYCGILLGLFDPKDGGNMFRRNIG